ncbi:hypothetical protein [Pantoea sp. AS142]|uniref:hypothetical protein n=1 Tax=Pantoea sp. AS142 TaxID=3081292 RepID=UPI00301A7213
MERVPGVNPIVTPLRVAVTPSYSARKACLEKQRGVHKDRATLSSGKCKQRVFTKQYCDLVANQNSQKNNHTLFIKFLKKS